MRLTNQSRRIPKLELSMTSMIDVVFLLLIFFLVTTTFVRPENQLPSAIRVDDQESAASSSELEPAVLDVFVRNGSPRYRLGAIDTSRLDDLLPVLDAFKNKSEGAFVRVSDDVPFDAAAQAIAACRRQGFRQVSYLPLPQRP